MFPSFSFPKLSLITLFTALTCSLANAQMIAEQNIKLHVAPEREYYIQNGKFFSQCNKNKGELCLVNASSMSELMIFLGITYNQNFSYQKPFCKIKQMVIFQQIIELNAGVVDAHQVDLTHVGAVTIKKETEGVFIGSYAEFQIYDRFAPSYLQFNMDCYENSQLTSSNESINKILKGFFQIQEEQ